MRKLAAYQEVYGRPFAEDYGACPMCKSAKARLVGESEDGFREVACDSGHRRSIPAGKTKIASLTDAVLGAPIGSLAAALSTKKEDRAAAIRRGLLLGALVGFVQGQRSNRVLRSEGDEERLMSPALASLLSGLAAGMYGRRGDLPGSGKK